MKLDIGAIAIGIPKPLGDFLFDSSFLARCLYAQPQTPTSIVSIFAWILQRTANLSELHLNYLRMAGYALFFVTGLMVFDTSGLRADMQQADTQQNESQSSKPSECAALISGEPDFARSLDLISYEKSTNPRLAERWAFVTGVTSGIGLHTAFAIAAEGGNLFITGRREDRLDLIQKKLTERFGVQVIPLAFDVSDPSKWEEAIKSNAENLKHLSMLVVNAGSANGLDPVGALENSNVQNMIETNVMGTVLTLNNLVPFIENYAANRPALLPEPTIITIGSIVGKMPTANNSVYSATKAFVHNFTDSLRIELGGKGVRVTLVVPGIVGGTEFSLVRAGGDPYKAQAPYVGITPLSPTDIADQILETLALPANRMIKEIEVNPANQANSYNTHRTIINAAATQDVSAIKKFIIYVRKTLGIKPDATADGRSMFDDLESFDRYYTGDRGEFYVMLNGSSNIVGTVGFLKVDNTTCELKKLYVSPIERGQGKGKDLLNVVLRRTPAIGCKKIILQTRPEMAEALQLYKDNGFKPIQERSSGSAIWLGLDL